jgi:hypothetical protein
VANKYDDTDSTANHREVKYKELRAKETKLKKMEELIKQKEKAAQECGLVLSVVKMVLQLVCSSCMPMALHV